MIYVFIAILVGIILLTPSFLLYRKALSIRINKEQQEKQKAQLLSQISKLEQSKARLTNALIQDAERVKQSRLLLEEEAKKAIEDKNYQIQVKTEIYKDRLVAGMVSYEQNIQKEYQRIDTRYRQFKDKAAAEIKEYENKIAALVENQMRQQKLKEDQDFFKIQLSQNEIYDIIELEKVKRLISKPEVVGKIIWSSYCLPKMGNFETRLLPKKSKVVGIYKITDNSDGRVYIGQSKDVATRWRDHIKCGLGATPAAVGNKLYQAMSQHGIWSFTFELLEECSDLQLNQKEKYWIQQYQSNLIGLNVKAGNK